MPMIQRRRLPDALLGLADERLASDVAAGCGAAESLDLTGSVTMRLSFASFEQRVLTWL